MDESVDSNIIVFLSVVVSLGLSLISFVVCKVFLTCSTKHLIRIYFILIRPELTLRDLLALQLYTIISFTDFIVFHCIL